MNPLVIVRILSLFTLISNIVLILYVVIFISRKSSKVINIWRLIDKTLAKKALIFAFILSSIAASGSLYFSEIAHFEPCKLCWFQRIFMYPLVIIYGVALIKNTKDVWIYTLPLSVIGLIIAIYNYFLQIYPNSITSCSVVGYSISCNETFFKEFGYITIPWMSFSAFSLITVLMCYLRKRNCNTPFLFR